MTARQPFEEMSTGEFWGSVAIIAATLLLTFALLWLSPPTPAEIEANRDTTETKGGRPMNAKDVEVHMAEVAVNNALATARELRGALLAVLNRSCSDAKRGEALVRAHKACAAAAWVDEAAEGGAS